MLCIYLATSPSISPTPAYIALKLWTRLLSRSDGLDGVIGHTAAQPLSYPLISFIRRCVVITILLLVRRKIQTLHTINTKQKW